MSDFTPEDVRRKKKLRRRLLWLAAAAAPVAGFALAKGSKAALDAVRRRMYARNAASLHGLMDVVKGDDEQLDASETRSVFKGMGRHYSHGDPSRRRLFLIGSRHVKPSDITAENGFAGDYTISPILYGAANGNGFAKVLLPPELRDKLGQRLKENRIALGGFFTPQIGDTFIYQKGFKNGNPSFSNSVLLHEIGHNSTFGNDVSPYLRKKGLLESILAKSNIAKLINPSVDSTVKEEERAWRNAGKMGIETGRKINEEARRLALDTYRTATRGEAAEALGEEAPKALIGAGALTGVGLGAYGLGTAVDDDEREETSGGKARKRGKKEKRHGYGRSDR